MYRTYYDTQIKVYHLLSDHPIMSKLLSEFEVDTDQVKDVALYLLENHDLIIQIPLNDLYYNSEIIETIGELYGFFPPFDDQVSVLGTPLFELLNFTIYLYKFGTTENFYEKNLLNFLPEYDRETIQNEPKLKLLYESIGRKLDDMELKISKMKDIYNIDEVPENLLDYLGQNIGYEKEDYTLKDVSFRELLKNIIEIYKIKGTNYSFSFFFKFLGFEISLKEFFFNHDVKNPEGFPGVEDNKVEYYLTTKNPIYDISNNKPANNLEQTKNINDFDLEMKSLQEVGCNNAIQYMLGFEPYNNDTETPIMHSNPWTYFKTNLIEYQLDPFFDKLNLTSNDNETIRKYVKFLSPTYLFTWINVNLKPWIEDINIIQDSQDDWKVSIINNLSDNRPTPDPWPFDKKTAQDPGFGGTYIGDDEEGEPIYKYLDYEPLDTILSIFNGGETLNLHIENNMNLGGIEYIGTPLRRDGIYIRQPGHPKFISNITHQGDKKISFDFMNVQIRDYIDEESTPSVNYYQDLPNTGVNEGDIYFVKFSDDDYEFGYYKLNSLLIWEYLQFNDYSYRSYPASPIEPTPDNNQTLSFNNILNFTWENIDGAVGYWIQVSKDAGFTNLAIDDDTLIDNIYTTGVTNVSNNKYYWRIKTKNNSTFPNLPPTNPINPDSLLWSPWSNHWYFTLNSLPFPYNGEIINEVTFFVKENKTVNDLFESCTFNMNWNNIPNSEKYQIQVLFNKPYVWDINSDILFIDTFSNLPNNLSLGTEIYVVDQEQFFSFNSISKDWVEISEPEEFSVVDDYSDLPTEEQYLGDSWFVINDNAYYKWSSIINEWQACQDNYGVKGNINTIDELEFLNEELRTIYFILASNEFYEYKPIEETTYSIRTFIDVEVKNNLLNVTLENNHYYWRVRSYSNKEWLQWGELYEFTVNFA